jgi:hypothetical protein
MHITKTLRVWLAAFVLLAVEGETEALDCPFPVSLKSLCLWKPFSEVLDTDTP